MNSESPPASIPSLLRDLRDETTTLLRQEVLLVRTEIAESVSCVGTQLAQVAIGAFVAYAGVIVLLMGIGHLLGSFLVRSGMPPDLAAWAAPCVVGLLVALIGWGILSKAKRALLQTHLAPPETLGSLRDTKVWVAEKTNPPS